MASIEPDSSPIATICWTMWGKRLVCIIASCNLCPVATSSRIFKTASAYLILPQAPATDCNASTRGTPAADMVDKVLENRAIADFLKIIPTTGIFSSMASKK